jgi:uncharacterized membrane protein HdeD (DUF308 family)
MANSSIHQGAFDEAARGRATAGVWGWPLVFSLAIVALGILALISTGVASLATVLFLGILLMVAGVAEIVLGVRRRAHGGFLLPFLNGLLSLVIGFCFLRWPIFGLAAATILLGAYFLASGLFRGLTSLIDRYPHWGWDFFDGVVCLILGIIVLGSFPISAFWVLGFLVGIELIVRGGTLLGASLALRRLFRPAPVA